MQIDSPEQIALFRYGLISPIVSRQTPLLPGELRRYLRQTAARPHVMPGSGRTVTVGVRTLERFLAQYRWGGLDALVPKPRQDKGRTKLAPAILSRAVALRREQPARSVEQILLLLQDEGIVARGQVAASTLTRHLRQAGVRRQDLLAVQTDTFRRFEARHTHHLWQADAQHTLHLPDPHRPGRTKKAILFATLDDHSRLLVHAQFYWDEKLPRLEDCLKKAILKHGIPEVYYCDNGAVFSSHHLARICGRLGIHLAHSRPGRPQGRGKLERLFRFVDTSFVPDVLPLIERGELQTLDDLNAAWTAWVDGFYHERVHRVTGQSPRERAQAGMPTIVRRRSLAELTDLFLWEESRTADKTACVSLQGNVYEVDAALARRRVTLRYDPFDLTVVQVHSGGTRYADAGVVDLARRRDRRAPVADPVSPGAPDPVSFLAAAERIRKARLTPVTYAGQPDGERS